MDEISAICVEYAQVFADDVLEPVGEWCRAQRARLQEARQILIDEPEEPGGEMDREIRVAWTDACLRTVDEIEHGLDRAYRDFLSEIE